MLCNMPLQFFGLATLLLVEYTSILAIFRYYEYLSCNCCQTQGSVHVPITSDTVQKYQFLLRFENTYESFTVPLQYLLFVTRSLSLIYILGISVIANDISVVDDRSWVYFTNWNTKMIAFYFLLAFISSITGLLSPSATDETNNTSSTNFRNNGYTKYLSLYMRIFLVVFEVAGGTSILVTVVAFGILDPSFTFWNVSIHFVTLLTLLIELSLNKVFVRFDHYPFNISWAIIYLIFIWILVYFNLQSWPYFFLKVNSNICYVYYTGLFLADFLFYTIWYSFSELKFFILNSIDSTIIQKSQLNNILHTNTNSIEYRAILIDDVTLVI